VACLVQHAAGHSQQHPYKQHAFTRLRCSDCATGATRFAGSGPTPSSCPAVMSPHNSHSLLQVQSVRRALRIHEPLKHQTNLHSVIREIKSASALRTRLCARPQTRRADGKTAGPPRRRTTAGCGAPRGPRLRLNDAHTAVLAPTHDAVPVEKQRAGRLTLLPRCLPTDEQGKQTTQPEPDDARPAGRPPAAAARPAPATNRTAACAAAGASRRTHL
jgi:hypothetical protein